MRGDVSTQQYLAEILHFALSRHVSHFSAELERLMAARLLTQRQLAAAIGVEQPQISRYVRGDSRPDESVLRKICKAIGESDELVAAYVRDAIPIWADGMVGDQHFQMKQYPTSSYQRLPRDLRELIDEISDQCLRSPEFVAALRATLALIRGKDGE